MTSCFGDTPDHSNVTPPWPPSKMLPNTPMAVIWILLRLNLVWYYICWMYVNSPIGSRFFFFIKLNLANAQSSNRPVDNLVTFGYDYQWVFNLPPNSISLPCKKNICSYVDFSLVHKSLFHEQYSWRQFCFFHFATVFLGRWSCSWKRNRNGNRVGF